MFKETFQKNIQCGLFRQHVK